MRVTPYNIPPSDPNAAPPVPAFAQPFLRDDPTVISQALRTGLLSTSALDLSLDTHLNALLWTLRETPTLPLPAGFLERLDQADYWEILHVPAIAQHLATRLDRDGWTIPENQLSPLSYTEKNIPPIVEAAILALFTGGRITPKLMKQIGERLHFSTRGRETITRMNRSLGAAKGAQTRRQARAQATTTPATPPPPKDPLIDAIKSGDAHRLHRFDLEHLTATRLTNALPFWLNASPAVRQHLLRVPTLPQTALVTALEDWAAQTRPAYAKRTVASTLLRQLSHSAVFTILKGSLTGNDITVDPWPDPTTLQDLLFMIAIQDPNKAAWLKTTITLRHWWEQLQTLGKGHTPIEPTDPKTAWIDLLCRERSYSRPVAIALATLFQQWSPERQSALAPTLLLLQFDHILLEDE